jgi:hypothetical protein
MELKDFEEGIKEEKLRGLKKHIYDYETSFIRLHEGNELCQVISHYVKKDGLLEQREEKVFYSVKLDTLFTIKVTLDCLNIQGETCREFLGKEHKWMGMGSNNVRCYMDPISPCIDKAYKIPSDYSFCTPRSIARDIEAGIICPTWER